MAFAFKLPFPLVQNISEAEHRRLLHQTYFDSLDFLFLSVFIILWILNLVSKFEFSGHDSKDILRVVVLLEHNLLGFISLGLEEVSQLSQGSVSPALEELLGVQKCSFLLYGFGGYELYYSGVILLVQSGHSHRGPADYCRWPWLVGRQCVFSEGVSCFQDFDFFKFYHFLLFWMFYFEFFQLLYPFLLLDV